MRLDDDRTDQRPDVRSKHPRWDIDPWPQSILESVLDQVLDYHYLVEEVVFNDSIISFRLHADSGTGDVSKLGHSVLVPLWTQGSSNTVFFANYWHGASTRFSRTPILPFEYNIPDNRGDVYYTPDLNQLLIDVQQSRVPPQLAHMDDLESVIQHLIDARSGKLISRPDDRTSDYTQIIGYHPDQYPDDDVCDQYLSHIPRENLGGLAIEQVMPWTPGDVIVFDRTQIHCAGSGHTRKIGVTIFTQRA